jgi:Biotin-requiring enzyme
MRRWVLGTKPRSWSHSVGRQENNFGRCFSGFSDNEKSSTFLVLPGMINESTCSRISWTKWDAETKLWISRRFRSRLFASSSSGDTRTTINDSNTDIHDEKRHDTIKNNESAEVIDTLNDIEIDRSKFSEEVQIRMPEISGGSGKVLQWFKKEGDIVRWEDVLCDIETDGM